ncbi:hypothetical protein HK098_006414 [Nowakowskiella sp. JEL0407]|nr:hypothetical protein HK098_006414 [Nowakowskiella sp. JEL0407]
MAIPQTQRIANLIEKTATFINSSANSQTEVLIRSKQSSNPDFGFLMRDHSLYPYFQHVRSLLKMGLGGYASDDSNSDADESESKQDNESNDSDVQGKEGDSNADILKEPDVERVDLTDEEANVIEKTAKFVAKNGSKFEDVVRERNQGNSRFDFLIPSNPLNRYYKMRVLFYS